MEYESIIQRENSKMRSNKPSSSIPRKKIKSGKRNSKEKMLNEHLKKENYYSVITYLCYQKNKHIFEIFNKK